MISACRADCSGSNPDRGVSRCTHAAEPSIADGDSFKGAVDPVEGSSPDCGRGSGVPRNPGPRAGNPPLPAGARAPRAARLSRPAEGRREPVLEVAGGPLGP